MTGDTRNPVTLISAINKKYSSQAMQSQHCIIFMAPNAPGKTASGNLRIPNSLSVNSFSISQAGSVDELSSLCADVLELDLTYNDLRSWTEIFHMIESMPKLEFLNLAHNPLDELKTSDIDGFTYTHLKKIVLNFTKISWESIKVLLHVLPNLEELYLSGNDYTDVTLDINVYYSLKLLQLTSNELSDWTSVIKLDKMFPRLTNLIIAYNNIANCGTVEENSKAFGNLSILNMNNTSVMEWNELDKLSCISGLSDIRLANIPLLEEFEEVKRRQLLCVYFPSLDRLNGSPITERETAERVYLRHFMDQQFKPNRYTLLEEKHGKLDPLVSVDLAPKSTIAITVTCESKEDVFDVSPKWTLGQLRRSLKSYVGTNKYKMYHLSCGGGFGNVVTELRRHSNNRFLYSLNVMDGDKLELQLLDDTLFSPNKLSESSTSESEPTSPVKEPQTKENVTTKRGA